jgi:hypothetical protein
VRISDCHDIIIHLHVGQMSNPLGHYHHNNALAPAPPSGLGSVLVTFVVTQNLDSIVICSFHEVKGRFAQALDIMESASPVTCDAPPVWGGQGLKRSIAEWPLTAANRHQHNQLAFCVQQSRHQNTS